MKAGRVPYLLIIVAVLFVLVFHNRIGEWLSRPSGDPVVKEAEYEAKQMTEENLKNLADGYYLCHVLHLDEANKTITSCTPCSWTEKDSVHCAGDFGPYASPSQTK